MIDLADMEGSYVATATLSRRARRIWIAVVTVCAVAVVGWVATLVVAGGPGKWWSPLLAVLPGVLAGAGPWVAARRPPRTQLKVKDLMVRTGFFTERVVAWDEVLAVRLPGRWEVHSTAKLRDGTELPLPGLDLEQAQRLADAVAHQRRPDAPAADAEQRAAQRKSSSPPPQRRGPVVAASPGGGAGGDPNDVMEDEVDWQGPFRTRPGRPSGEPTDEPRLR